MKWKILGGEGMYVTIEVRKANREWQLINQIAASDFDFDKERFEDIDEAFRYSKYQTYENSDDVMWDIVSWVLNADGNRQNASDEDYRITLCNKYTRDDGIEFDEEIVSVEYRGEILQYIFPQLYERDKDEEV